VRQRVDVVVVGAGIGGLTAAVLLGAAGLGVRVIERASRVGGKAGVQEIDGIEVDTGPSLLTLPHVFDDVFAAGQELGDVVELVQPEPAFQYVFRDGTELLLHHDPERSRSAIEQTLGSDAAREFQEYLRHAERIWEAAAPHFVFAEAPGVRRLLGLGPRRWAEFSRIDALSSLERSLSRLVREPHLRDVFRRFATYNGSDVRQAPGTLACIAHVELGLGAYGVRGGLHALGRALEGAARGVGVEFELGQSVRQVMQSGGTVSGVHLDDGRSIGASHVLLNTDAGAIENLLGHEWQKPVEPERSAPRSMSAYTGIVRARRREGRRAHTVLFPSDYLQEFADIFDRRRVPRAPAIYVCALEKAHARRGWAEHEPLFVMINAPALATGVEDAAGALVPQMLTEALLERGQLDVGDEIVWWRTPADLAREFPGSQGALYGEAFHGPWAAFRRPKNQLPSARGLYLASGSGHPGGGVPLAAQSGKQAAASILGHVRGAR